MFQKSKNQQILLLEFDYENGLKSQKSSTKMVDSKLLQKLYDLFEEILHQIKKSNNLYLTNKIAKLKQGEYNAENLLQNFKFVVSLILQELLQYQMQVEQHNFEPNKIPCQQVNQLKFDLQKSVYDNSQLKFKIRDLEQQLQKQQQLNSSICEELVTVKSKLNRNLQTEYISRTDQNKINNQSLKDKLKQLHQIFEISKEDKYSQQKVIMTEPCEENNSFSGYYTRKEKSVWINPEQKCKSKQNKTAESKFGNNLIGFASLSQETFDISDSFSLSSKYCHRAKNNNDENDTLLVKKKKKIFFINECNQPNSQMTLTKQNQYK